jgi:hypothetical protein
LAFRNSTADTFSEFHIPYLIRWAWKRINWISPLTITDFIIPKEWNNALSDIGANAIIIYCTPYSSIRANRYTVTSLSILLEASETGFGFALASACVLVEILTISAG